MSKGKGAGGPAKLSPIGLIIQAGKATPAPPVGPALSQKGLNIMEFCKQFNAETQGIVGPVPVVITPTKDKKFTVTYKTQPASYLIKKKFNLTKGSQKPGSDTVLQIKASELREIAEVKMKDVYTRSVNEAISMIAGTARSMGIDVDDDMSG